MGSVSNPAIVGNTRNGAYDEKWASLYSLMDFPQYYPELVKKFGKGFDAFEFLTLAGQVGTCAGQTKTLFSEGARDRYVTLHTEQATALVGADIVVEIEEWDASTTTGQSAISIGDKIAIPGKYCTISGVKCVNPQWYQVHTIATVTGTPNEEDTDITATPLNALTVLAIAVPAATKLFVTGGNYAAGSAGAKSKTSGWYSETFTTGINKAAFDIEGSQQSNERYTHHLKGGGMGLFSDASIAAEFRLDSAINYDILLGDTADNLTMLNRNSGANTVRSTKGIMPHLNASGCKLYYDSSFTVPDLYSIKDALISQGVTDGTAAVCGGSKFIRGVTTSALDFIKEYSGGSNLLDNLNGTLKAKIQTITLGNLTLSFHEFASFSNPNALGLPAYAFDKKAIVIPETQVTVRDTATSVDVKSSNIKLLYKNFDGENRTRIFKMLPGVNGLSQINSDIAVDSYDSVQGQFLSEYMLMYLKINQSILIQDSAVL